MDDKVNYYRLNIFFHRKFRARATSLHEWRKNSWTDLHDGNRVIQFIAFLVSLQVWPNVKHIKHIVLRSYFLIHFYTISSSDFLLIDSYGIPNFSFMQYML